MNAIRKIKRTIKKAKPNTFHPGIKLVGQEVVDAKYVNPDAGIAAIDTDEGIVMFDTEFTGELVGKYFAISGMKEHK